MDLVRLAIVYDTGQASASLDRLNRGMEGTERGLTSVRRGLSQLAFTAAGIPGPIGRVAEGLLQFGGGHMLVLSVVAGFSAVALSIKAMTAPTDTVTKSLEDFTKGLKNSRDAGEQLREILEQIPIAQAKSIGMLAGATGAGAAVGPGGQAVGDIAGYFVGRGVAGAGAAGQAATAALAESRHRNALKAITDLEMQTAALGQNADAIAQVTAAQGQWNSADTEAFRLAARKHENAVQALADLKAQRALLDDLASIQAGIDLPSIQQEIGAIGKQPLLTKGVVDFQAFKTIQLTKDFDGVNKKILGMGDASKRATDGLLTLVGALAQVAGILFPNDPAAASALTGIASVAIGAISSGGSHNSPGGRSPTFARSGDSVGVTTNVNFNVAAMDAQGVAAFVQQNGPQIAAEVTRQADRSRSIRRRFWRG